MIAPWREWELLGQEGTGNAFAESKHGIPISTSAKRYSMDANMLHTSFEGSELENPANDPHESCHERCVPVEQAPDKPEIVESVSGARNPVSSQWRRTFPVKIMARLAEMAGRNGIGRDDIKVENRYVGMWKCRGVYEKSGRHPVFALHRDLEGICMDRELLGIKGYALCGSILPCHLQWLLVFAGKGKPCRPFSTSPRKPSRAPVKAKLCTRAAFGRCPENHPPLSFFSEDLATFEGGHYDHKDAAGFIRLNGLRLGLYAQVKKA